jgi:lambda family phage minor tail protein L
VADPWGGSWGGSWGSAWTTDLAAAATIASVGQSLAAGDVVHLFELDATAIGGDVYRFTMNTKGAQVVSYGGHIYTPIDIEAEGFEWNGRGTLPTPRIRIANAHLVMSAAVIAFDDLLGATLTRLRTFRRFLDGEPDADPDAHYEPDIFRVERKVSHNKIFIEWELSAAIDQEGRFLPGRQALRDSCTHRYRVFRPELNDFDFTKATCPYEGDDFFSRTGAPVGSPALDDCGKKLSDCTLRFGTDPLPTRAFPGLAKVRVQ